MVKLRWGTKCYYNEEEGFCIHYKKQPPVITGGLNKGLKDLTSHLCTLQR